MGEAAEGLGPGEVQGPAVTARSLRRAEAGLPRREGEQRPQPPAPSRAAVSDCSQRGFLSSLPPSWKANRR